MQLRKEFEVALIKFVKKLKTIFCIATNLENISIRRFQNERIDGQLTGVNGSNFYVSI